MQSQDSLYEDERIMTEMEFRVQKIIQGQSVSDETDHPPNSFDEHAMKNNSLFFADGLRSVDFVLVYKELLISESEQRDESDKHESRNVFEEHLISEGLEIERENVDEEIHFVKIHAPIEVLRRQAEILKLRLPIKEVSLVLVKPQM